MKYDDDPVRSADRRPVWLTSAALALFVSCGHGRVARASPEKDADAIIARGIELRRQGRDEEALALFNEAQAMSPSPRARAQVALAEQALGLWLSAEAKLVAVLAVTTDPWITKNRAALEGALAVVARHVGSLEVYGPEGAEVVLDGVSLGTLPSKTPFRVEVGPRTLELRKAGFHTTARAIEIPPGGVARASIVLAPLASPPASVEPPVDAATEKALTPKPARPREHETSAEPDPGHVQRLLGWTFAATGVGLVAAGGIGLIVRTSLVDSYNDTCPGLGVAQPADCDEKLADARTWLTVSIISLVTGGIFATGGATLVLSAPSRPAPRSRARVGPACAPNIAVPGLSCSLAF